MAKVAIVEDEFIVALDIKSFLERSGYSIAGIFASGEDLLKTFAEIMPDLVLMDIKIRGKLDGVETAKIVHETYYTPVVLLTAFADDATIARAKITQPFGYIIKPYEERELKTSIEIALYRASMEKKLRESEERYRNLFQEGISANFIADNSGTIVEANPAFRVLLGLSLEDPLPNLSSLIPNSASLTAFLEMARSERGLRLEEMHLHSSLGRELIVLANAAVLHDSEGAMIGLRCEFVDMTERRKLEERITMAQKMEAAGKLAGGIAHDFNNILTAIIGYSNLLVDEIPAEGRSREDVEGIRKAADRASKLTRQLLAFSRRQPFSPQSINLNETVKDTERLLRRILPENIFLSLALSHRSCSIFADPAQIEQVILNLAFNARDAMPDGGNLRLSTEYSQIEAPLQVGLDTLAPGSYVVLAVSDSGTGIAPEIVDRIFEPFFTTKPKDMGTGLGLSTVYGIARQMGGAVGVSSTLGHGASFHVWMPFDSSVQKSDAIEVGESIWKPGPGGTVLFVDDDEALRSLAARMLERGGYKVLVAANAGEAILIAESYGPSIDLLITDTVMPFLDGRSLAARLKIELPSMAVLYTSGHADLIAEAGDAPDFLAKPFDEQDLAQAVGRLLAARKA